MEHDYEEVVHLLEGEIAKLRVQGGRATDVSGRGGAGGGTPTGGRDRQTEGPGGQGYRCKWIKRTN